MGGEVSVGDHVRVAGWPSVVRPFVWDAYFIWRRGEEVNLYDCTLEY